MNTLRPRCISFNQGGGLPRRLIGPKTEAERNEIGHLLVSSILSRRVVNKSRKILKSNRSKRNSALKSFWNEPLFIVSVPIICGMILTWSFTQLRKLQKQIDELREENKATRQLLSESQKQAQAMESSLEEKSQEDQEAENVAEELERVKAEWSADQNRIQTLEKARAAAVKDVTNALASKRDVEFSLKEAAEKTENLQSSLSVKDEKIHEFEVLIDKLRISVQDLRNQKTELEGQLQDCKPEARSGNKEGTDTETYEKSLAEVKDLKKKLRDAEEETQLMKNYTKSEMQLMTMDLVRVRDQKDELALQTENLTIELSEAENKIKDLEEQLRVSGLDVISLLEDEEVPEDVSDASTLSESYMHEMRAEAALFVEEVETKASLDLEHAMKRSLSAEKTALRGLMIAAKEKEKSEKFKKNLDQANERIDEQQKEIWYLKDRIRVLLSDIEVLSQHYNTQSDNS